MKRFTASVLFSFLLAATGCSSGNQTPVAEPTPSNQAPEESGGAAESATPVETGESPAAGEPGGASGGSDRDGDGIVDDKDRCPDEPEDRDGFQDEDGCPDPDNDQDGILDIDDKCPAEPESKNGRQDEDGCPD